MPSGVNDELSPYTKVSEVPAGEVFSIDTPKGQKEFIKLKGKFNAVNLKTWVAAQVHPDTAALILGGVEVY
jgi:hypothetical protein